MRAISQTTLRRNLSATLDRLTTDHESLIIPRDQGHPASVLMSFETFASHQETNHLLKSPVNAARLLASIAELGTHKPRAP